MEFQVSDRRKAVWAIELKMMSEFQRICSKYELRYFAIGGTLLGAIRHGGYIPWDDDMDFGMPREDYEKFIAVAREELPDGMILQCHETDKSFFIGHAKIRMDGTTAIRKFEIDNNIPYHQGIFIDVFPCDNVPDKHRKLHMDIELLTRALLKHGLYNKSVLPRKQRIERDVSRFVIRLFGAERIYCFREKLARKYNTKDTKQWGLVTTFYCARFTWDRSLFSKLTQHEFSDSYMAIPEQFDDVLRVSYGDWNVPVMQSSMHGDVFFDCDRSYLYYKGKEKELKEIVTDYEL